MSEIQHSTNLLKHTSQNIVQKTLLRLFYKDLLSLVRPISSLSILDVGAGEGFTLKKLDDAGLGRKLEGIDESSHALKAGKKLFPKLTLKKGDIYKLPYNDNSFDLVICNEVLEHLEHPKRGLKEVMRVTKKYAIFSVPHEPFFTFGNFLRGRGIKSWNKKIGHINFWTFFSFQNLLKKQGVRVIQIKIPFTWILVLVEKPNKKYKK